VDLNYLYYRHGISRMLAEAATSSHVRSVHEEMATAYAARISDACLTARQRSYWTTLAAYEGPIVENQAVPTAGKQIRFIKNRAR
jgi:hypothetical protein